MGVNFFPVVPTIIEWGTYEQTSLSFISTIHSPYITTIPFRFSLLQFPICNICISLEQFTFFHYHNSHSSLVQFSLSLPTTIPYMFFIITVFSLTLAQFKHNFLSFIITIPSLFITIILHKESIFSSWTELN